MIYYFVFFRTGIEKAEIKMQEQKLELEKVKQNAEELEKNIKQQGLAKCLDEAYQIYTKDLDNNYKAYSESWNAECKRLNLPAESPLPNDIAERIKKDFDDGYERITKAYENGKNDCFKFWQN